MRWDEQGMTPARLGALIAALTVAADQVSKNFLLYGLDFKELGPAARIEIAPFFDLVLVWNRGISYGLFQAGSIWGTIALTVFSLAAVAALSFWLSRAGRRILAIGLGLVIGGAIGNVIDRVLYAAVVDFFHFYAFGRDWYVFNVADAAITVGVVFLLLDAYKHREEPNTDREPVIRK
jgi:signal peptidase II